MELNDLKITLFRPCSFFSSPFFNSIWNPMTRSIQSISIRHASAVLMLTPSKHSALTLGDTHRAEWMLFFSFPRLSICLLSITMTTAWLTEQGWNIVPIWDALFILYTKTRSLKPEFHLYAITSPITITITIKIFYIIH